MKDNLARKAYAEKIATEFSNHYNAELEKYNKDNGEEERENLVFAISGKWGEGKTGLLKLLVKPLKKHGFRVIWFNPWKYSQEDITLKRAFLSKIKEKLKSTVNLDDLYYDRTKTTINVNWFSVLYGVLILSFFLFIVPPAVFGLTSDVWLSNVLTSIKSFFTFPISLPILTVLIIPILVKVVTLNRSSASVTTAEEFEQKFEELLKAEKKIVFFIDDLDRCNPKTVKTILDSLRTFFQHPECSYLITGDHTVVERYAGDELELPPETSEQVKLQEGRRFLKKLFDVYWRLPLPTVYQFEIFVNDEIANSQITLSDAQTANVKSFLSDDALFERNLRHVKRFLTKLRFALEGVELQKKELEAVDHQTDLVKEAQSALQDILDNPDLLGKVLLIEEFFYPAYEKLILHPEALIYQEKGLRASVAPVELKIDKDTVGALLDSKKPTEAAERYASLVAMSPKFTDDDNSTIHEVGTFISFSGSTGLPSTLGPDEANFEKYLQSGQLVDKLGRNLEVSKPDKKALFVKKNLDILATTTDEPKFNAVGEAIKLSSRIEEWSAQLVKWKDAFYTLPTDKQDVLIKDFWKAILVKKPELIATVKSEKPEFVASLWPVAQDLEKDKLHKDVQVELAKIVKENIAANPPVLGGVEIFLKKFGESLLDADIDAQLTDPAKCKVFLDELTKLKLGAGTIADIAKKKLRAYVNEFSNIDWTVANKDFLKSLNLFDGVKAQARKWAKDASQLVRVVEQGDILELSEEDKKVVASEVVTLTTKSANVSFLDDVNVQTLLTKEDKVKIFSGLKTTLNNPADSMDKRKQAAEFLFKNKPIWNGVENNDVYDQLKEVGKFKFTKISELKDRPKEILGSWDYE